MADASQAHEIIGGSEGFVVSERHRIARHVVTNQFRESVHAHCECTVHAGERRSLQQHLAPRPGTFAAVRRRTDCVRVEIARTPCVPSSVIDNERQRNHAQEIGRFIACPLGAWVATDRRQRIVVNRCCRRGAAPAVSACTMRIALIILLAFHGTIHLLGFLEWSRLAAVPGLSGRTLLSLSASGQRAYAFLWLVTMLVLLAAAAVCAGRHAWWWAPA